MARQERQQIKLLCRKVSLLPADPHAPGSSIDLQPADLDHLILLHVAPDQPLVARQVSFHPGNQLARAERLGHIIVCSQTKPPDLVNIILFRRHHDDRSIFLIPDLAADFKPVHSRQHQVQDDQVEISLHPFFYPGLPVIGDFHLKITQLQIIFLQIRNALFVFHDQNTLTHRSVPPDIF